MIKKIFHFLGWAIIIGNLFLIGLVAFWLLYPYKISDVKEPIEVLNENKIITIGEPIKLKIEVNKPNDYVPVSQRFITCRDGNLVTLASSSLNLPKGQYTIFSDNIILPLKVAKGSICKLNVVNSYKANPLKTVSASWVSEEFKVAE